MTRWTVSSNPNSPNFKSVYGTNSRLGLNAGARRFQSRNDTPSVSALTPTTVYTLGNTSPGGSMTAPKLYKPSSGRFRIIGPTPTLVASPAALAADEFYSPAARLTANGDQPSYRVEFMTDAPIVEFNLLGSAAPKLRVWIDGQVFTIPTTTGLALTGSGSKFSPTSSIAAPTGASYVGDGRSHFLRLTFGNTSARRIGVDCGGFAYGGVRIPTANALWRPPVKSRPRVMFLGDSYTAGTGADVSFTNYAWLASYRLGWDLLQSGAGGTGYINPGAGQGVPLRNRLANDCYPEAPDAIVIAMGLNDIGSPPATVGTEAAAVFADIATNLPDTPVIVVGAWQPTGTPSASLTAVNAAILAAAAAAPNVITRVDPTGWIEGTGRVGATNGSGPADYMVAADGAHVTQAGHEWLGMLLADALATTPL